MIYIPIKIGVITFRDETGTVFEPRGNSDFYTSMDIATEWWSDYGISFTYPRDVTFLSSAYGSASASAGYLASHALWDGEPLLRAPKRARLIVWFGGVREATGHAAIFTGEHIVISCRDFYGNWKDSFTGPPLGRGWRIAHPLLHELGHYMGLKHCNDRFCPMYTYVSQAMPPRLCAEHELQVREIKGPLANRVHMHKGDVDRDGFVTVTDSRLVLGWAFGASIEPLGPREGIEPQQDSRMVRIVDLLMREDPNLLYRPNYRAIAEKAWIDSVIIEIMRQRADVNGDGRINIIDTMMIAQYANGVRELFPTEI